ncbi:hypothetical protein MADA3029_940196 [Vibrio nigripulchritudo MADA3029]|nr:hypothetical protein VIBNIMADA3020_910193 [Vibrio nigripulchritudo MADA3020]CCN52476.1 hypothetical protein VIBNIMADA3021_1230193 [Vibrio nigripulchritudo MADA3021]CCN62304.1 hypothetical protein MADA3029_940196 [Vibrio nigripulchritudo MADA3029]
MMNIINSYALNYSGSMFLTHWFSARIPYKRFKQTVNTWHFGFAVNIVFKAHCGSFCIVLTVAKPGMMYLGR